MFLPGGNIVDHPDDITKDYARIEIAWNSAVVNSPYYISPLWRALGFDSYESIALSSQSERQNLNEDLAYFILRNLVSQFAPDGVMSVSVESGYQKWTWGIFFVLAREVGLIDLSDSVAFPNSVAIGDMKTKIAAFRNTNPMEYPTPGARYEEWLDWCENTFSQFLVDELIQIVLDKPLFRPN